MPEHSLSVPDFVKRRGSGLPLGDVLLAMQREFPPFNFYADKPDGMTTNDYLFSMKPVPFQMYLEYGEFKRLFLGLIKEAEHAFKMEKADIAVEVCETLIRERYPNYKPYDLLIRHYRRAGDAANELRVLDRSINFFAEFREMQRQYVLSLSRAVGKETFALERINAGKKIHYFGGAFVIYDPVKVMGEWENRRGLLLPRQ